MNRLRGKGYVGNPIDKAKSVGMTEKGFQKAKELFEKDFTKQNGKWNLHSEIASFNFSFCSFEGQWLTLPLEPLRCVSSTYIHDHKFLDMGAAKWLIFKQLTKTEKSNKKMKDLALVSNEKKYSGKYVATRSFKNKKVIASGTDPLKVYERAKRLGIREPVLLYVPEKDEVLIY